MPETGYLKKEMILKTIAQIIFPPQFEPFQPYLSLPYLKGLLKIYGIESKCFDANVDFYWWLFTQVEKKRSVHSSLEEYLYSNIGNAVRALMTIPQNLWKYRWAVNIVDEHLKAVSPDGVKISLTSLTIGNKYSSEDLRNYIQSPNNIFREYFEYVQSEILSPQDTQYYLFSLVVLDQLGAALTFAKEIKRRRPHTKVVFGGPFVSRFYKRLVALPWINEIVDILVPGEAYKSLSKIFGLRQWWTGHISPDFSDLDMNKYLSPRLVLPYLIAHGCKWGLCTFCTHHLTYSEYRVSSLCDVVQDISGLVEKYGVEYISFSDEYLSSEQLSDLVRLLEEKKINIKWSTFVRAESKFSDKNFTKKLYEGGARLLMFGFESTSQRILRLMRKGTNVDFYSSILESCKDANISVRLDFMVGFPTETEEDAQRTFTFIKDNSEIIDTPFSSYAIAVFELREGTPIMHDLKKYGVKVVALLRGDLDEQYDFVENRGLSQEQKRKWRHKMIAYLKNELSAELITPQNKTHQLCLKYLFDKACFELPVKKIETHRLQELWGIWNHGVVIRDKKNGFFIITNFATGGVLELVPELFHIIVEFETGGSLYSVFSKSTSWTLQEFIKLINFLFRNDYLLIGNKQDILELAHSREVLQFSTNSINPPLKGSLIC